MRTTVALSPLLALALCGATLSPAPAGADLLPPRGRRPVGPAEVKPAPVPAPPITTLIGVLTRQFTGSCVNGQDVWGEPSHLEVGFVRLTVDIAPLADKHLGQVVVATGVVSDPNPPSHAIFNNGGLCSVMQMRDDWVVGKGGIRSFSPRGGALARVGVFSAQRVSPAPPLRFSEDRDQVVVKVENPLDRPLRDVALTAVYEGCFGKPGQSTERRVLGTLPLGGSAEARVPRLLFDQRAERAGRATYHLSAVRLDTTTPGVAMDLEVRSGVDVRCPRD